MIYMNYTTFPILTDEKLRSRPILFPSFSQGFLFVFYPTANSRRGWIGQISRSRVCQSRQRRGWLRNQYQDFLWKRFGFY